MSWLRVLAVAMVLVGLAPGQVEVSMFSVATSSGFDLRDPDAAYDAGSDLYLIVWEDNGQIVGRRVRADGTVAGSTIALGSGRDPRICNLPLRGAWVVAWASGSSVLARAVFAISGALSNTVTAGTGLDTTFRPLDVGGQPPGFLSVIDDVVVAWSTRAEIRAAVLEVGPGLTGSLRRLSSATLATVTGAVAYDLRVSPTAGTARRFLVGWTEEVSTVGPNLRWITGMVVAPNLNVLDPTVALVPPTNDPLSYGGADGDGTRWVATYQRSNTDVEIYATPVEFDSANPTATSVGTAVAVDSQAGVKQFSPTVAWTGSSAVLTSVRVSSNGASISHRRQVDPFTCTRCGPWALRSFAGGFISQVAVASQHSGNSAGEGSLMVWLEDGQTSQQMVATGLKAQDGETTNLGGGCGQGGRSFATCATRGHNAFHLRVRDAAAAANALLFVSTDRIAARCGPCTLVPDPLLGVVVGPYLTDSRGRAELAVPLPNSATLQGIPIYLQWLVRSGQPRCPQVSGDFSNAMRLVIE